VQSINVSGHKFGLVYPGVGWILWRDAEALPQDLVFKVNYLGGEMPTFALNFSRPGAQVVAQYYNFLRLGTDGYTEVQAACRDTAQWLAAGIERLGPFTLVSRAEGIPVIAFRLGEDLPYSVYDVSEALRARGWLVPAYTLPPALDDVSVLRVVVRNGFGRDLAKMLLDDLGKVMQSLATSALWKPRPTKEKEGFHH
jgi:glutamate decarboxylase